MYRPYIPHVLCIDPGVEREPDVTFGSSKIELGSSILHFQYIYIYVYIYNTYIRICIYLYIHMFIYLYI